jgi:hypothetical protein
MSKVTALRLVNDKPKLEIIKETRIYCEAKTLSSNNCKNDPDCFVEVSLNMSYQKKTAWKVLRSGGLFDSPTSFFLCYVHLRYLEKHGKVSL